MVHTFRFFFSSKCSLFHNSNIFGSCIIHILYTGVLKLKNNSGAKRLSNTVAELALKLSLSFEMLYLANLASACLHFGIGSRTDVGSVRKMHYLKQAQYVEPQEDHVFRVIISIAV